MKIISLSSLLSDSSPLTTISAVEDGCCNDRLSSIVPAEIMDLDTRDMGVEVTRLGAPLCLWEVIWAVVRSSLCWY